MRLKENPEQSLGPARRLELAAGSLEYHETGRGRPVVFVHGLGVHAGLWRKVVPPLASHYRCLVPTLPLGAHRIPMQPDADLSPTGIADLLAQFLDVLDLHDAVVVGNDTGGAYTQILLTRHATRIGAAVLTSCDAFGHFWVWDAAAGLRRGPHHRSLFGLGLLSKHGVPDAMLASYLAPLAHHPDVRRDLTKVLTTIHPRYLSEAAARLRDFGRPVLIAWAAQDQLFPVADARRLLALLPQAQLEIVHDSYTYIPEDQPERLAHLIHRFLAPAADGPATGRRLCRAR